MEVVAFCWRFIFRCKPGGPGADAKRGVEEDRWKRSGHSGWAQLLEMRFLRDAGAMTVMKRRIILWNILSAARSLRYVR